MRTAILALLAASCILSATGCGAGDGWSQPRLVVLISIDQMRQDYLTRFEQQYEGGFGRLLKNGAVFENARYRHGVTVTAAGHAVLSTGLHPSHTGMVGNSWFDPGVGAEVNCIADEDYEPIGGPGRKASPLTLLADTLGDRLAAAHEGSQIVSVSWKDRAAILMAGRAADAAYWFSSECGCFITSSYYEQSVPQWLAEFNARKLPESYLGRDWQRLRDDVELYNRLARGDEHPTEGARGESTFPHKLPAEPGPRFYDELGRTPYNDELTLAAALAMIDSYDLGADSEPDLLAVGFSATDLIGHRYGPRSQEAMDNHLRLDGLIGKLLTALDERVGLDNVVVALSADHGAIPLPEALVENGVAAGRTPGGELARVVNEAIAKRHPKVAKATASINAGNVYLDLRALEEAGVQRAEAEQIAREALLETDYVEQVFTHADLLDETQNDDFAELYRNSLFPRRSPHLFVRLAEYRYPGAAPGTGHGSPYDYDRHVPLILMGPDLKPGRYQEAAGPEDLAPTLGLRLGVEMPLEPDARRLTEAVLPPT